MSQKNKLQTKLTQKRIEQIRNRMASIANGSLAWK